VQCRVRRREPGELIGICDPIRMEVLAPRETRAISTIFADCWQILGCPGGARRLRRSRSPQRHVPPRGETVRELIDCLIGAIDIRGGVPVLQADSGFQVLAGHTALQVAHA
jgi:hypothetical protein